MCSLWGWQQQTQGGPSRTSASATATAVLLLLGLASRFFAVPTHQCVLESGRVWSVFWRGGKKQKNAHHVIGATKFARRHPNQGEFISKYLRIIDIEAKKRKKRKRVNRMGERNVCFCWSLGGGRVSTTLVTTCVGDGVNNEKDGGVVVVVVVV